MLLFRICRNRVRTIVAWSNKCSEVIAHNSPARQHADQVGDLVRFDANRTAVVLDLLVVRLDALRWDLGDNPLCNAAHLTLPNRMVGRQVSHRMLNNSQRTSLTDLRSFVCR